MYADVCQSAVPAWPGIRSGLEALHHHDLKLKLRRRMRRRAAGRQPTGLPSSYYYYDSTRSSRPSSYRRGRCYPVALLQAVELKVWLGLVPRNTAAAAKCSRSNKKAAAEAALEQAPL